MKKLSLFAFVAAGLLLGACADKDTVNEVVQTPDFTEGAYIGISIQMPSTTATTRANEQFKDGAKLKNYLPLTAAENGMKSDLIRQKKMGNDFYGAVASLNFDNHNGLEVTVG